VRSRIVSVVGAGTCEDDVVAEARAVGRLLGERGAIVVCGGRGGVMSAASAGVRDAGGLVIGILPGEDRTSGNEHLSVSIATGLGEARNAIIARACDSMIAVGGEYGTLSEMALALKMRKRVISLRSWRVDAGVIQANSPEEAVTAALEGLDES